MVVFIGDYNLNFSKPNVPAELWEPFDGLPLLLWVSLTFFIIIIIMYFRKLVSLTISPVVDCSWSSVSKSNYFRTTIVDCNLNVCIC